MAGVKPVKKAAGATAKVARMDLAAFNSLQSAAAELKKHMNCINPYTILKESIFHLVLRLRGGLRIFSIDVEAADTIDNVKDKIQDKEAPRPISSV